MAPLRICFVLEAKNDNLFTGKLTFFILTTGNISLPAFDSPCCKQEIPKRHSVFDGTEVLFSPWAQHMACSMNWPQLARPSAWTSREPCEYEEAAGGDMSIGEGCREDRVRFSASTSVGFRRCFGT